MRVYHYSFCATRIRINVSWSGSGSGQIIRINRIRNTGEHPYEGRAICILENLPGLEKPILIFFILYQMFKSFRNYSFPAHEGMS